MTRPLVLVVGLAIGVSAAQELRSTGGLAPGVVGRFRDPSAFQQSQAGDYYVFDRAGHSVYRVGDSGETTQIVQIGPEDGRILGASSFHMGPDGRFVVADAPEGRERVQIFDTDGSRLGGFRLPGRATPRITLGNVVLSGVASLQFTGRVILMSQPELGGLMTEFSLNGHPFHTFGVFRETGHEDDRDVHLALNSGVPLVNPTGGYYFVFQAGIPILRRYDANGQLVYERHIEGRELDPLISQMPNTWPRRAEGGREVPIVPPVVRTAAVDPDGYLWVVLTIPYIYVFDPNGEKVRTVRLRGAGVIEPTSLSFTDRSTLLVTPGCYEFTVR